MKGANNRQMRGEKGPRWRSLSFGRQWYDMPGYTIRSKIRLRASIVPAKDCDVMRSPTMLGSCHLVDRFRIQFQLAPLIDALNKCTKHAKYAKQGGSALLVTAPSCSFAPVNGRLCALPHEQMEERPPAATNHS